jgi:hypothetical protein
MLRIRKVTLETTQEIDQVEAWFNKNTHSSPNLILDSGVKTNKAFKGIISRDHFRIIPAVKYRNSFIPIIEGTMMDKKPGAEVIMRIGIHSGIVIFIAAFLLIALVLMAVDLSASEKIQLFDILFLSIIVFTISVMTFLFFTESDNCISKIQENLNALKK